jgi:hypothetical protein
MTNYKTIKGKRIKFFTSDLDNEQAEGQIFYQDTANEFKTAVASSAWHSGANLNTARDSLGSFGIQTASVGVGGNTGTASNLTEEYNGSGWTTGTNYPASLRWPEGTGTLTAGIVAGGGPSAATTVNKYDGTSWTSANGLPTATYAGTMFGVQTSSVYAFGTPNGSSNTAASYHFDGTNWTNGGTANTARRELAGSGTLTSGLVFGGTAGGGTAATEEYDGTSWTTSGNLGTARYGLAGSNAGTQDSSLAFAGGNPAITTNERYNGSTWSTDTAVATAARFLAGTGTASSALKFGGYTGTARTTSTEEYNVTANTITAGTWSSGGTIPFSSNSKNGSGILTAAFVSGGETPPGAVVDDTAEYNGTSWTAGGDINSARGDIMAGGTQTAGLIFGGFQNVPDPNFLFEETEEYNGTSWSEQNDMPTGAYSGSGTGTQTAAFACNMYIGSPGERSNVTYEYDGTNWSNGGNTAETTNSRSAVGTLTAGLAVGGRPAPSTYIDETELYDGTSWTAGVDMISIFQAGGQTSKGTQTDCMIFGSPKSPVNTDAFKTDGTTWFTQPSLGSYQNNGTGTSTAGLAFGIGTGSQEFAGETTSLNLKTITDS